ncbi:M15 family metallopeptidase [Neptunomonas phycophila]|uniref:D-alanyl-D-alanine dipeptidase n=1 Tax=Neptunomonas phycophila TaxID=1572645 RepID=A0AAW7XJZ3_9GAMM|nr:M15 family metallopeptidase [Neptunomonas phycophila]MDO6454547.1 M15 family metallopeptidase [Neptunomonas phycophila]MDO6468877.1 M15 family metallopeptidase [Neptunomonas phycophila]MDP2522804.1 M15 family metallopeptidase [Neptunomonas phycophila]
MKYTNYPPIPKQDLPDWELLSKISIIDNNEPLQPVSLSSKLKMYPAYYKLRVTYALPECFVRDSVLDRLHMAADLLPSDLSLVVLDGWRPFSVQQYLFDTLVNLLKKANPEMSLDKLLSKARTLVSPPSDNPSTPSPHLTGGAVDVTLCDTNGRFLDMGTSFDEASDYSWTFALEEAALDDASSLIQARNNRRVLFSIMQEAGFTNLASEWWHYDFGDQLWAERTGSKTACFGATSVCGIEQMWKDQINSIKN